MHSSLPPPPDNINEDDYRKQLRKMQRSLSPGSVQRLQSAAAPAPRVCRLNYWSIPKFSRGGRNPETPFSDGSFGPLMIRLISSARNVWIRPVHCWPTWSFCVNYIKCIVAYNKLYEYIKMQPLFTNLLTFRCLPGNNFCLPHDVTWRTICRRCEEINTKVSK